MPFQLIPGNNAVSIDEQGWLLHKNPHGTFYSAVTQAIADTAAAQVVALELDDDVEGLIHSRTTNNSRIQAEVAGSYEIFFSGISDVASGAANKYLEVWIRIDGVDVANTNTITKIQSTASEGVVAVAFSFELTAGQYVELVTWGDATTCQWLATAVGTTPTRPACPSVIVTMKKVSSTLSFE